jgi:hypothetical protein
VGVAVRAVEIVDELVFITVLMGGCGIVDDMPASNENAGTHKETRSENRYCGLSVSQVPTPMDREDSMSDVGNHLLKISLFGTQSP